MTCPILDFAFSYPGYSVQVSYDVVSSPGVLTLTMRKDHNAFVQKIPDENLLLSSRQSCGQFIEELSLILYHMKCKLDDYITKSEDVQ